MLKKYCHNPGIISWLTRKQKMDLLRRELAKISRTVRISIFFAVDAVPEASASGTIPPTASQPETANVIISEEGEEVVTYESLERHNKTTIDEMPTDYLKDLWLKNREEYKELQYSHSQMKLANSDVGRAEWREKVVALAKSIKERWSLIDKEIAKLQAEKEHSENALEPQEQQKQINFNSYRSYISKALNKKKLSDSQVVEVKKRVAVLLANNVPIFSETMEKLKAKGLL